MFSSLSRRESELLIAGAQRGDQLRHIAESLQPPESFDRLEDTGATQRSIIFPPRQRLTFRFTCRVRLIRLSAALVEISDRCSRSDNPRPITVNVSSSPSRTLSAALGYSLSSRRVRSCRSRRAVGTSLRYARRRIA